MLKPLVPSQTMTLVGPQGQPYWLQLWLTHPQAPTVLLLDGDWVQDSIQHFLQHHPDTINIASLGYSMDQQTVAMLRAYDFTPPHPQGLATDPRVSTWKNGGALAFCHFLTEQVLPALSPSVAWQNAPLGLFGHSYAGLFTLYAWLQRLPHFTRFFAASPSVWWRWPYLPTLAASMNTTGTHSRLEILLGENEHWHRHPARPGQNRSAGQPTLPFIESWLEAVPVALRPCCNVSLCPNMGHGPMLAHAAAIALERMRL